MQIGEEMKESGEKAAVSIICEAYNHGPYIKDALEVENNGKRCVMEVSQHLGNNVVRCIMLSASEGLQRDREVTATGSGIKVPVGDCTLGRLFNVLGDTVDGGENLDDAEH